MNATIAKAVEVLRQSPDSTDIDVFKNLLAIGLSRQHAARLVELLPIAYSRMMFQQSGVRFSGSFSRERSAEAKLLSDEPLWNDVCAFAADEIKRGITSRDLFLLAARSAELDAINQSLNNGGTLDCVVVHSLVFLWPFDGPESTEKTAASTAKVTLASPNTARLPE